MSGSGGGASGIVAVVPLGIFLHYSAIILSRGTPRSPSPLSNETTPGGVAMFKLSLINMTEVT